MSFCLEWFYLQNTVFIIRLIYSWTVWLRDYISSPNYFSGETDPLAAGSPDSFDNDADKLPGGSETDSMAEYGDVDPSKFNEDGSFIGKTFWL